LDFWLAIGMPTPPEKITPRFEVAPTAPLEGRDWHANRALMRNRLVAGALTP